MSNISHREWIENNALTCKDDMNKEKCYKSREGILPFANKDWEKEAIDALTIKDGVHSFPMIDSRFKDPEMQDQMVGCLSFVPARGAIPNKDGCYGMVKLRGNFPNDDKAKERTEFLIKNYDTYHYIHRFPVGVPYPLGIDTKLVQSTTEVKINEIIAESISADIKKMREDDTKTKKEIADRERKVLEDNEKKKKFRDEQKKEPEPDEDPKDHYTTLRVKRAQIIHTYLRTRDKLAELKSIIVKTKKEYEDMEKKDPTFEKEFLNRYLHARDTAGLEVPSDLKNDASFLQFLAEDRVKELDFDENAEVKLLREKPVEKPIIEKKEESKTPQKEEKPIIEKKESEFVVVKHGKKGNKKHGNS